MKNNMWKNALCLVTIATLLCACGKTDSAETNQGTSPVVDTVENNNQFSQEPEWNKVYTENNGMYDQGRKEKVYDTLYANYEGLEIWGEGDLDVDYKEGVIIRQLLFKNTSDQLFVLNIEDVERGDFSGSFEKYIVGYKLLNHPNGGEFYVNPGEEYLAQMDFSPAAGNYPDGTQSISGDLSFDVTIHMQKGTDADVHKETFQLKQNITRVMDTQLLREQKSDGIVRGTVTDEGGNPIAGAFISLIHPGVVSAGPVQTDADGNYRFETGGYKTQYAGAWREASLVVEADGYDKRVILAYPKDGQEVVISPTLYKKSAPLYYEQTAVIDTGLQSYEYDSDNKSIIAFVPFHTEVPSSVVKDRIRLTVTDFDGNILFTHALPEEVPYVDVSEDGQYIVSFEDYSSMDGYRVIIFDKTGKEVYAITSAELPEVKNIRPNIDKKTITRCAQLSNDNQYLVLSDTEGRVWVMDWNKKEVVWSDFLDNQVRNIKFAPDNESLYISSGDGYIYAYDMSGKQLWKQFVQSWAPRMYVTEHYVINTTKSEGDGLTVTDRATGKVKWSYPTQQGAANFQVSADESMIWFGNHSSTSYSVLNSTVFDMETGEVLYQLNGVAALKAEFTKDGSKIISADRTSVYVNDAKTGALLWSTQVLDDYDPSMSLALAVNEDGSKFAVAMNNDLTKDYYGQVYFFRLSEGKTDAAAAGNQNASSGGGDAQAVTSDDVAQILRDGGTIHVTGDGELVLNGALTKDVRIEMERGRLVVTGNLDVSDDAGCLTFSEGDEVDLRGLTINNSISKDGEYHLIKTENCHTVWPVDGAIQHNQPVKGMLILLNDGEDKELVYTK